jgi:hypothetical protein
MTAIEALPAEDRVRVGDAWLEAGLGEHASVAAFARFVLHLLSLGAPPDLVRAAIRAMDDEVEHARLCFGIARRFTGMPAGPGPMNLSGVFAEPDDLHSILEAAILEGCIAETISARCAQESLKRLKDDSIQPALTRIAEDESRHADLSWDFVSWILASDPSLKDRAAACFARALDHQTSDLDEEPEECAAIEDFGHLTTSSRAQLAQAVIQNDIRPRMDALLN